MGNSGSTNTNIESVRNVNKLKSAFEANFKKSVENISETGNTTSQIASIRLQGKKINLKGCTYQGVQKSGISSNLKNFLTTTSSTEAADKLKSSVDNMLSSMSSQETSGMFPAGSTNKKFLDYYTNNEKEFKQTLEEAMKTITKKYNSVFQQQDLVIGGPETEELTQDCTAAQNIIKEMCIGAKGAELVQCTKDIIEAGKMKLDQDAVIQDVTDTIGNYISNAVAKNEAEDATKTVTELTNEQKAKGESLNEAIKDVTTSVASVLNNGIDELGQTARTGIQSFAALPIMIGVVVVLAALGGGGGFLANSRKNATDFASKMGPAGYFISSVTQGMSTEQVATIKTGNRMASAGTMLTIIGIIIAAIGGYLFYSIYSAEQECKKQTKLTLLKTTTSLQNNMGLLEEALINDVNLETSFNTAVEECSKKAMPDILKTVGKTITYVIMGVGGGFALIGLILLVWGSIKATSDTTVVTTKSTPVEYPPTAQAVPAQAAQTAPAQQAPTKDQSKPSQFGRRRRR